jgi:hypothetical protein
VLTSVNFDRKLNRRTIEIEDIVADRVLTTELQIIDLAAAQSFPEFGLRVGHNFAQPTRAIRDHFRPRESRR